MIMEFKVATTLLRFIINSKTKLDRKRSTLAKCTGDLTSFETSNIEVFVFRIQNFLDNK